MKKPLASLVAVLLFLGCRSARPVLFEKDGDYGYKTASGRVLIPPQYLLATEFNRYGRAFVLHPRKREWVMINEKGDVLVTMFNFDNGPDGFEEGLARFVEGGRMGFVDERGVIRIPARYEFAYPFEEGRARVGKGFRVEKVGEYSLMKGGLWGEIDRKGNLVKPYRPVK